MRRILSLFLIISAQVFLSAEAKAQTPELACPSITIEAKADRLAGLLSSRLACPGAAVTFTAVIAGNTQNDKPTFNWTISSGEIISGQGTFTIKVLPDEAAGSVTATVEVGNVSGLRTECNRQASATIEIALCCLPPCPTLEISCPTDIPQAGKPVPVSINISGGDPNIKPKYHWQVSAEKIVGGQGTPEILVDITDTPRQSVTATVEVDGLPPACDRTRSCSFFWRIGPPVNPSRKFDEYSNVSWISEEVRLANFGIQLEQERGAQGYVIIYGPRGIDQRLERVRKFLIDKRSVEPNRLVLMNGGTNRKAKVELWIRPTGADPPESNPNF
jgi:hypothetical protein